MQYNGVERYIYSKTNCVFVCNLWLDVPSTGGSLNIKFTSHFLTMSAELVCIFVEVENSRFFGGFGV